MDEDADQDAVVVGLVARDDAALDRVDHGARDRRLRRSEHLHRLLRALDRDLVEEDRVGLRRQVRRHDREQRGEAVLVVRERVGERRAGRARLRSDDQVDVRHLVAIADQRLTDEKIRCHLEQLPSGKVSNLDEILTKCSKRFQQSGRAVLACGGMISSRPYECKRGFGHFSPGKGGGLTRRLALDALMLGHQTTPR